MPGFSAERHRQDTDRTHSMEVLDVGIGRHLETERERGTKRGRSREGEEKER